MIQFFKDAIKDSWVLRIFLGILTISFGVWGVGDSLAPGMNPNIAISVGKNEIPLEEVQRQYNRQIDQLRQSQGAQALDNEQYRRNMLNAVVQDMTQSAVIDAAAQGMGINVTSDRVRAGIQAEDSFKDETGKFSQMKFAQTLYSNNLTETAFVKMYEADLRRQTLLAPVAASAAAPKVMVDGLFTFRAETRIADTLLVAADAIASPGTPTEEQLKKTLADNGAQFTAPEYRKITAVVLQAEDLVKPDSFSDEEVKAYYDQNISRYRTPAKRHIAQLVFDSKEHAEAARAAMAPGDDLNAIASKSKIDPPIDLGELTKDDGLAVTIGDAYNLPVGAVSEPVETPLGWHLFQVVSETPETSQAFETARDQIRKSMADEKGADAIYDASVTLEDESARGTPMDEIAKQLGARLVNLEAVDQQGFTPTGRLAAAVVDDTKFLRTAFSLAANGTSPLMDMAKGYYVIHVDSITPPAPKALDTVRKDVIALWDKQARMAAARDLAAKVAADLGPSTPVSAPADKDKRLSFGQLGPVTRFGESLQKDYLVDTKRVSPAVLEKMFASKVGDVFTAEVATGVVVGRLKEITLPKPEGDLAAAEKQLADEVKQSISQDLLIQFTNAFGDRNKVAVNTTVIEPIAAQR